MLPTTVRATVDPRAIEKTSRFFSATLTDIFTELFQNARRAGASCVTVVQNGESVSVIDDGAGIDNPASLLRFGGSNWSEDRSDEDPAGMGFFALARRGATVVSRARETGIAFSVVLTPDVFDGIADAAIDPYDTEDYGTTVSLPIASREDGSVKVAAERCAKYLSIPVFYATADADEMEQLPQQSFLEGCHLILDDADITIGITLDPPYSHRPDLLFHGVAITAGLPRITEVRGRRIGAKVIVKAATNIKLVLPARKEIVQDDAWSKLKVRVERAIFRSIEDTPHRLTVGDRKRASALGVHLSESQPWLAPFSPTEADHTCVSHDFAPIPEDAYVLKASLTEAEQQCLAHALTQNPVAVFEPEPSYEGYWWYDSLPTIDDVTWIADLQDGELRLPDLAGDVVEIDGVTMDGITERELREGLPAENMTISLRVQKGGHWSTIPLDADIFLIGGCDHVSECVIAWTKTKTPDAAELETMVASAFFCPSDDAEADSWHTQREAFVLDARARIFETLFGPDEATKIAIETAFCQHVRWICPADADVVIKVTKDQVAIELSKVCNVEA